jgi:MoxR-like ATPase
VVDVAPDVLRHRLVLSYEALADGVSVDDLLTKLLATVQAPRLSPSQDPTSITSVTALDLPSATGTERSA